MLDAVLEHDATRSSELIYLDLDDVDFFLLESWFIEMRNYKRKRGKKTGCAHAWVPEDREPKDVVFRRIPIRPIQISVNALAVSTQLATVLRPFMSADIAWGNCYIGEDRAPLPEYVSIFAPLEVSVYMRGDENSTYKVCACGVPQLLSNGSSSQLEAIPRNQLRTHEHVYVLTRMSGLLITPILSDYFPWDTFPHLRPYKYPVLDAPIDGREFEIDNRRWEYHLNR